MTDESAAPRFSWMACEHWTYSSYYGWRTCHGLEGPRICGLMVAFFACASPLWRKINKCNSRAASCRLGTDQAVTTSPPKPTPLVALDSGTLNTILIVTASSHACVDAGCLFILCVQWTKYGFLNTFISPQNSPFR